MPSFLSKLLGRKKVQGLEPSTESADNPGYPAPLLDGKFEAISPNVSPSAALFTDPGAALIRGDDKPKDKEPFSIFRARSRVSSELPAVEKTSPDVPHLSLHLPITKNRRALDVVFGSNPEAFALLNEAGVNQRRLTPHEALSIVRACSQVIIERGLETLGVMHPHWHSTSPEVQHRLISLHLLSLTSTNPDGATSPTVATTLESELHFTRSPHDVAAVLRWALRHLKLDGDSFGKESGDWSWYNTFAEAERVGSYPPDAFSNSLIPQLPAAHTELLLATLDIISSLSARSEANGSSGSKLSKFFGLWLLTSDNSTECDNWNTFYDRWDRAGRILEHLFLARIRNDAQSLPRRLTDLVEHYPYDYGVDTPKDELLPRPRFSTRQYDALFVQVDTEYTGSAKPKSHPLRLIADALHSQPTGESATTEDHLLWDAIKKASFTLDASGGVSDTAPAEPIPTFSNVFSDETIRLFSLIPVDVPDRDNSSPIFALRSPISPRSPSFSLPETPLLVQADRGRSPLSGHPLVAPGLSANNSTAPPTASPETPTDWLHFSNRGFGTIPGSRDLVATLWDDDVEKTDPPASPLSRKSSRRAHSRHSSIDTTRTPVQPPPTAPAPPISKVTLITKVKLDEAFIDFWADSLLDQSSRRWPCFVLCQLKPLSLAAAFPTPAWLVIEQRFVRLEPPSPVKEAVEATVPPARPRASSPLPSSRPESSRLSAAFSIVSKKRFTLFAGGSGDPKSPKEKDDRLPQVGELGEDLNGSGEDTAAQKPEETDAKDGVDKIAAPAATAVDVLAPVVVGVSAVAVAAAGEDITETSREDDLPARTTATVPSELVGTSASKADEPVKDEPPHGALAQNGLANGEPHEEQHEVEPDTAAAQGPASVDAAVIPPVTSEPIEAEADPAVFGVEEETTEPEALRPEPAAIPELSAPELSSVPVEEASPSDEMDTTPTIPLADAPVSEELEFASPPAAEPTPVPVESALVQAPVPMAAAAIEEPLIEVAASQVAEPEPVVEVESTTVAEVVLVSETPNGDSPSELAPPPAPLPVSEQPVPEEEISTVREAQIAASADLPPTVVDEDQAVDSADAAEMTAPLEEPTPTAGEPTVEEDAQPIDISERDDAFPEEPDVDVAAPKPATVLAPVADDTTLLVPDQADSATAQTDPEAPVPSAEPEAEHEAFVTQSPEECLPSQATPKAQDPVIDEQPLAEEPIPIPDSSISGSIPTKDLVTTSEDETDAAPLESTTAEDAPATELVPGEASASSEILLQEVLEEPDLAVMAAGNASPIDEIAELKAEAGIVAESQAATTESESAVISADEPSVPMPEISASVTKQPAPPTEADILVDTLAPVAQETGATSEEAAPSADAETPEAIVPEVAETSAEAEAPASVPVESDVVPEEAAPATTDPFVVDPVPATEESTPATEDAVPAHDHALAEQLVSVPEEPTPVLEDAAAPADPAPVPEESAPVTDAAAPATTVAPADPASIEEPAPETEAVSPATEIPHHEPSTPDLGETPALDDSAPILEEDDPAAPEPTAETQAPDEPVVPEAPTETPALDESALVFEEDEPAVPEPPAETPAPDEFVFEEDEPAAPEPPAETQAPDESAFVFEEDEPAVPEPSAETPVPDEPAPVLEEDEPVPVLEDKPVVPEASAETPVANEPAHVFEEDEPTVPELPADAPEPAPVIEEDEPVVPEALAETPVPDEPALILEEDEPTVPEPPADAPGPAPVIEEDEPVVPEALAENPVSDEPAPILEEDEPTVPEPLADAPEPAPVIEEGEPVVPEALAETPVPDEPAPILEEDEPTVPEPPADAPEPAPVIEEGEPVVPEALAETPVPGEPAPVIEEDEITVSEPPAETPEPASIIEDDEPAPVLEEDAPMVQEPPAERPEPTPVIEEDEPGVPEALAETPVPDEPAPVLEEDEPVVPEPPAETPEPVPIIEEDEPTVPEPPAATPESAVSTAPAETPVPDEPALVPEEDAPVVSEAPAETPAPDEPVPVLEEGEPAVPEPLAENPTLLPENPAPATEGTAHTTDETPAETAEDAAVGLSSAEPAQAKVAVDEPVPADGQVAQEPAAPSSSEAPAIAPQEPPSVEAIAASEPEEAQAPLKASTPSETNGAADAEREHEVEELADEAA